MKKFKKAFTLIEMIIVIVIMGIASKFGAELLMRAYEDYVYGTANNRLMAESEAAVTQIANRLQYRIKESIIFREGGDVNGTFINSFTSLASANYNSIDSNTTVVEWVGYDNDGWRGDGSSTKPTWSGIIDLEHASASNTILISPESNATRISSVISALSYGSFNGAGSALFFIGDESVNVNDGFGWNGNAIVDQNDTNLHRVNFGTGQFTSNNADNFSGVDIYEYYRLAWTAYALEFHRWTDGQGVERGTVWLYYNYRPWLGENYTNGEKVVLMENVQTLRFSSIGDVLKVQVCVGDGNIFKKGAYSVCKEKTVF